MNYIRQSRAAFKLLASIADATPYHVSLYNALFQIWNEAHFPADILLFRNEVMRAAHIGSPKTYRNCLRDLTAWGLITYQPSHCEHKASRALMHKLDIAHPAPVGPEVPQPVSQHTANPSPAARSKSDPTGRATSDPTTAQPVPPLNKLSENYSKPPKENGTPFSRTAAAPEKKREGDAAADQYLGVDDFDLNTQRLPKEKVAPKRKGAEAPQQPRRPEILFAESELARLDTFIAAFAGTDYELANLRYYHELVTNWRQHGEPPLRRDWLATTKKFMLNDMQDGKLKLATSATHSRVAAGSLSAAGFGAAVDAYADGRYA